MSQAATRKKAATKKAATKKAAAKKAAAKKAAAKKAARWTTGHGSKPRPATSTATSRQAGTRETGTRETGDLGRPPLAAAARRVETRPERSATRGHAGAVAPRRGRWVTDLTCTRCGQHWDFDRVLFTCPDCGDTGILDVGYDYAALSRVLTRRALAANHDWSLWRYLPLLPVTRRDLAPNLQVGWTPLYAAPRLAERLDVAGLYVKDEGRQPSASLKDRASAVGLVRARELGRATLCAASTGNAAASLACLGASVGIHPIILVPRTAPRAKLAQLQVFGARVLAVDGSYDDAFDLSLHAARAYGWYTRSTAVNPVLSEGKKTAALELCEQLGWRAPDVIAVSVGDGCIIGGLAKGLLDLRRLGLIERLPRLLGAQAEGSSVLAEAFAAGAERVTPRRTATVADSICVDLPRDPLKALRGVRATGGSFFTVSDQEILAAIPELGRGCGVFCEPAGATAWAAVLRARQQGWIRSDETVVVIASGNGLKDVEAAIRASGEPPVIAPTPAALDEAVRRFALA